ncbi:hypothetical protein ACIGCP_16035 [Cellulophaga baltica]|uniref:hypothetical protein n=1 Tax=Cellulophaga TaxID=104264 RepID=UPI00131CD44A|nr:hypothetical protein [Cellulophaga sp. L1A9]
MEQENIETQKNKVLHEKKRPSAITVICILGFIGAAFTIPLVFSDIARQIGSWYPPYLGLSAILGFTCMIGLWQMKKWAAYTYTAFVVLNQIILLVMGVWNIMALIIPAIVVAIALTHLKKMD